MYNAMLTRLSCGDHSQSWGTEGASRIAPCDGPKAAPSFLPLGQYDISVGQSREPSRQVLGHCSHSWLLVDTTERVQSGKPSQH